MIIEIQKITTRPSPSKPTKLVGMETTKPTYLYFMLQEKLLVAKI